MEMHHVQYFLALCDECNFTRAAKRCNVSQPSLTNAIKKLEVQLGGHLFFRNPVQLTRLGRSVKPHLKQILRAAERAHKVAKAHVRAAGGYSLNGDLRGTHLHNS
jgi:LysR family transcriptional regulator, hydrogen peroxide-inducible genes activator